MLLAKASQQQAVGATVATTDDDGGRARLKVPLGRPIERVTSVRSEIEQLQKDMLEQF